MQRETKKLREYSNSLLGSLLKRIGKIFHCKFSGAELMQLGGQVQFLGFIFYMVKRKYISYG